MSAGDRMPEVLIAHISFSRHEGRGEDGAVWYLILGEPNDRVVCAAHPGRKHHYERQAFRRGTAGHRLDATPEEIAEDRANVWGWDGSVEAPTVTPSFLAHEGRPYRLHSFLRGGRLDLCGDSTVVLSTLGSCWGDE
jgi:hypothetical protein